MLDYETSNINSEVSKSNSWKITSFSKTVTSEGGVSHNVVYYQQLPIGFIANSKISREGAVEPTQRYRRGVRES